MEVDPAQLEGIFKGLVGWVAGLFALGALLLLFRSTIESVVAGWLFRRGSEVCLDQPILIGGRPARLIRSGILTQVFYMEKDRGSKMIVPNSQLCTLVLEVRLLNGPLMEKRPPHTDG
jgi:hypothetical protein